MSANDFWAKVEQEKKKKYGIASSNISTPRVTVSRSSSGSSDDFWKKVEDYQSKKLESIYNQGPISTVKVDDDEDDVAPVKERKWFDTGLFDDGYDKWDVTKTILGSVTDVAENLGSGIMGMGERAVDALAQIAPYIAQGQFYQNGGGYNIQAAQAFEASNQMFKKDVEKFVKKDLYDEEKVAKAIITNPVKSLTGVNAETDSVFGEKTDSLVQSGGQLLATAGLQAVGVPWYLTTGATSFGGEAENALKQGASMEEAALSAAISAGAEILTEKISGGISFGGKTGDEAVMRYIARAISDKTARTLTKLGVDMVAEGGEEVLSSVISNLGSSLYKEENLGEILASEEAVDEYIESFIGGAVLGGVGSVTGAVKSNKAGVDSVTGLTTNEQSVVDKLYQDRLAEAEKSGETVNQKKKSQIYDSVLNDLEKGYISTETIEEVLGGETFKQYQETVKNEDALQAEFDTLNKMKQGDMTGEQIDRRAELKEQLNAIKTDSKRNELKTKLGEEVFTLAKSDRLVESYNERGRRSQAFEADLTKYDSKQQAVVKKAVESGILNNTNRTHEFVDFVAKISADKGVLFDFTNNTKLKESGFAVDGKFVNGYITKDGVTVNIQSAKSLDSVVGHEIAHVLEGTDLYTELQSTIFEYAKSKNDYQNRYDALTKLYENVEGANIDAELTADLIGDYLFTDTDFINNLSVKNRNIFEKIYDEVKYLFKVATAGSSEARKLEKVKRAFEKAYAETGKAQKNTAAGGAKYKLSDIEIDRVQIDYSDVKSANAAVEAKVSDLVDRGKVVPLSDDSIASYENSVDWEDKNAVRDLLEGILEPNLGVSVVFEHDGQGATAYLTRQGINHSVGGPASPKKAAAFEKFSALVKNAEYAFSSENDPHSNSNKKIAGEIDWDTFVAVGSINGKPYPVTFKIRSIDADVRSQIYEMATKNETGFSHGVGNQKDLTNEHPDYGTSPISGDTVAQDGTEVKKQFSMSDSAGKQLTEAQVEYFKDSVVRDENGNLKPMYHGTSKGGFNVFDTYGSNYGLFGQGSYFTDSKTIAESYTKKGKGKNPQVYETYLNITNPIDMDGPADAAWASALPEVQFPESGTNEDFYRAMEEYFEDMEYPKWEAAEYAMDVIMGMGYDGITHIGGGRVNSEGERHQVYIAFNQEQVKNSDNANPTTSPDIRYSLSEDSNLYDRIYDMQIEVNRLTESIREFENSADFKAQMNSLSDAISSGDIDRGMKEYQQWLKTSGYGSLKDSRDTLRDNLEKLRKQYNDEFADNAAIAEKANIEKSGLSEADYFRKQAVKEFGYTPYFYDAGYITPNGKMLNFSGEKGKHFGSRGQDHRGIGIIYENTQGSAAMVRFMNDGNIRIMGETPGVDISSRAEPSAEQYATIRKFARTSAGQEYFAVDISDENGRNIGTYEYNGRINADRIVNDIKYFFQNGKVRESSGLTNFLSLSEEGEQQSTKGRFFGKDIALETAPVEEVVPEVAPVQEAAPVVADEEEVVAETVATEELQDLFPDDLAPIAEAEEAAWQTDRLTSLEDSDMPPEADAPYPGESMTPADPFADRDMNEVGKRNVKAYMYENPEVKPYFQEAAYGMLGDLHSGVKGEKWFNDDVYYASGGEEGWGGTRRQTTADIADLLDNWNYTYDQIEKGLNAIIEDHGAENNAVSKRIEFMLDDRLRNGYTGVWGENFPPNQEYINLLNMKQINEYSDEAFAAFMLNADQYAPVEEVAPAEDVAPVTKTAPAREYESIRPRPAAQPSGDDIAPVYGDKLVRVDSNNGRPGEKQRKWVGTSTESEVVNREILPDDLDQNKIFYQPISNKVTLGKANSKLSGMGYESSVDYFNKQLANKRVALEDIALGERLIQEAMKRGDTKTAGELIQNVAILGTELGQKVQALSIIQRLTPEGQLKMLQKTIERGKTKGDKAYDGVVLTQEMIDKILKLYGKDGTYDQAKLNKAVEDVKQQIADQMKVTALDKVNAWRYLSMLGNPKTHIRNIVSNVAMRGTVAVKNVFARAIESIAPVQNRTKTFARPTDVVKQFSKDTAAEMKDILTDDSKYSEDASIKQKRDIFKNKILNGVYEFNSDLLSKEDWWFSKPAFVNSLSEFLTVNGIRTEQDIQSHPELVEKAKLYATEQSQIATFRQFSWLSNRINDIERHNTLTNVAVGAVLPFKKTPINIAKAGLSYSPLGFVKALTYDAAQVKKGNMEVSQMIDNLAQGLTGSALTLVGYMLASTGFLSGGSDDDKESKYDYQLGEQSYSVNIGGKSYSLSWLSPVAMPLFVGANAFEQLVEGKEWNGDVVVETLAQTLDPLNEMSFLSGLTSVLSSYDSGMAKFAGIAETMAQNYITQFVPTFSSQVATVMDDTKRSTKADADSGFKFFDQTINKLKYKIPFLRETLEPSTDIWGNEIKQTEDVLTRAFETFLAPYAIKKDTSTAVDEEIKALYRETGENGIIPSVPYSYIVYKDNKYDMSAKEHTKYKEAYGKTAFNMLEDLFDTETYRNATASVKADLVEKVYDYAREGAKRDFLVGRGVNYTNAVKDDKPYFKRGAIAGAIANDMMPEEYTFSQEYPEKYEFLKEINVSYTDYQAADEETKDAYNWAFENPEKYTMSRAVSDDVVEYRKYSKTLYDIRADKDSKGNSIRGTAKKKKAEYISSLNIEYGAKLILFKNEYNADDTYNREIVEYLNNKEDISYEDMVTILTELGFYVSSDGTVRW